MRQALKLHPESQCDAVTAIEVEVARPLVQRLRLAYHVNGRIGDLSLPPLAKSIRADELWRTTCFEAFVRAAPGGAYNEFNFAPSTQWAAYRFDGYRRGMAPAAGTGAPRIETRTTPERYELTASLDLASDGTWHLGLSAVIEEAGGRKSYWALAHPPGKPDFHHSDCFALEVPAA